MSRKKQTYNPCDDCQYSYSKNNQESGMCKICEFPYFRDRKQSEGEWIKDNTSKFENRYNCSVCDYRFFGIPTPYCPKCGAKMKGA